MGARVTDERDNQNRAAREPDLSGPVPEIARDIYPLIITIDGPAGTGKSTVARKLAQRLGMEFLDTGAMYRAATALAIDHGAPLDEGPAIADLAMRAEIHFDWRADPPALIAFGERYTERLRDDDVNRAVSPVSGLPELRAVLVRRQRLIGSQHPLLVTEGRDQGSIVFPDAGVKFYLDASPRVRALRRARQTHGEPTEAQIAAIEAEIAERDRLDTTRAVGPLIKPEGAEIVDTSGMPLEEVVEALEQRARARARARRS
jgi:cytidylate kinase